MNHGPLSRKHFGAIYIFREEETNQVMLICGKAAAKLRFRKFEK